MKFWDSSAAVSLLLHEQATRNVQQIYEGDSALVVWWATVVECASALARAERTGVATADDAQQAFARLRALAGSWTVVEPSADIRDAAIRFVRVHDLRAADALQLAAAYLGSGRRPSTLEFVCRDDRLARAAEREGFVVR